MEKLLLGVDEVTAMTGIGRSKLYQLMAEGQIESVRVGKRRLFPVDSLEAFIQKLREAGS